jgi:filamentous hemagglutinin
MVTNFLLGVKDAVVSTVNGLIDGIKYVWNNPLQTIEGVTFFSRALHSGTEENDLLVQMIEESGKELSKEFIEGDADKKARMLGQAVGEVLLALVSTKGVTAAVDAIKAGIKSGELASWFSKFSKGTATAEDIANGLGKTAETVDKADDSVKIIGNIEGAGKTLFNSGKISIEAIEANPSVFSGKSASEIADMLQAEGYDVTIQTSTKSSTGAQIIKINNPGNGRNISQVQVSPGGGRHGENPYVKISTTDEGIIKIVDGAESTYKTDGTETAKIIFTGGE